MTRRVLSVWFPHLSAEREARRLGADPARPFAVVGLRNGAARLSSVNAAAERVGLRPGAALTDARATTPDLATTPERPARDAAFLRALGRWCERYAPWVALDGADGLALDVTGCAHLFGGERALIEDMTARLAARGLTARAGLAEAKGAAWALARFAAAPIAIAAPGRLAAAVADLPAAALRVEAEIAAGLARLGLHRIQDVAAAPRASLARRFGSALTLRLAQIFGEASEPIAATAFARPYAARLSLPEPIGKTEDVRAGLERLLARLCARLEQERLGARAFRLSVRRCDAGEEAAEIGLARPSHDPARAAHLFDHAIEGLRAADGVDALRLEALRVEPIALAQQEAFQGRGVQNDALSDLIARLGNRVGFERVTRFLPAESHSPERAFLIAPAAASEARRFPESGLMRPLTLFAPEPIQIDRQIDRQTDCAAAPPMRFRWRGVDFELESAAGPERLAPEWWREDPLWRDGPRDYWRAQTRRGRRLWLFQTHGEASAAEPARWFVQGEFA